MVASVGKNLAHERLKILRVLWDSNFKAEMLYDLNPKPDKQLKKALNMKIPIIVWIGEDELKNNTVKVKKTEENQEEVVS